MSGGGALLVVGFAGPRLEGAERRQLARVRPGGVILFARNLRDLGQLERLVSEIREVTPGALLCVDAEGGRVDRLRALAAPAPAAASLARLPVRWSLRSGRAMGEVLRACGFDLDFAPVADLDRGERGNALDGRCLGASPRGAAARAGAFLAGLASRGVAGCPKHFPGLGGARADTHAAGAPIALSRGELARDLAPFRRLAPRAAAMMAGHAAYPAWDPSGLPATLSRRIATGLLRGNLGYRGLLFSDDLEMGALADRGGLAERAEAALAAGCDGLLVCSELGEAGAVSQRLGRPLLARHRERAERRWRRLRTAVEQLRRAAPPAGPCQAAARRLGDLAAAVADAQNGMSSSSGPLSPGPCSS
ncbi:MAG: beta-N-acetylhexosaminidase [Thermoanaerobaculia bacterium]|nr:beta-N-acetylhexosaminidase [Thermoanaerobaculia bacterium]